MAACRELALLIEVDVASYHMIALRINLMNISAVTIFFGQGSIKVALSEQFFNFLVRLLFKCGFYSMAAEMQCSESAKAVKAVFHDVTCTVKVKLDFVIIPKLFQNVNKYFGMQKAVAFRPTWTIVSHHFQATASN